MMRRPTSEQRCQEVRARLRERTTLSPLEERRITAHVGNCPSCGAEQWLQARLGLAADASREALPAERVDAIWAGISRQLAHEVETQVLTREPSAAQGTPARPLAARRTRWLAPALVAALAASVAIVLVATRSPEEQAGPVVAAKAEERGPNTDDREPRTENRELKAEDRGPAEELAAAELEGRRPQRAGKRQRGHEAAPSKGPIAANTSTFGGGVAGFRGEARALEISTSSLSAGEEVYARANAHRARGELVEAEHLLAELSGHGDVALANAARLDRARLLAHGMNDPSRAVATLRAGHFDAAAPLDAELRITLCSLLLELSRVDEARACLDELRAVHPPSTSTPSVERFRRRLSEVAP